MLILRGERTIGGGAEVGRVQFVSTDLASLRVAAGPGAHRAADAAADRELILAAAAERRCAFAAENQLVREALAERGELTRKTANAGALIVQADDIHGGRQWHVRLRPIHCAR